MTAWSDYHTRICVGVSKPMVTARRNATRSGAMPPITGSSMLK